MSRQQNIKQGNGNGKSLSLYCKVCHDAGKEDYNKHGLKDKDGKTTCPYLLSLKCNNCKEFGHTQKYCTTGTPRQPLCTGRSVIGASSTTTPRHTLCTGRSVIGASSTTTPRHTGTSRSSEEDDKFCAFCFNIDKNDLFYKTHYVRKDKNDTNSEVTCPRLKTTECNYCHELGHTPVNCDRRKRPSAKKAEPVTAEDADELKSYDVEKLYKEELSNFVESHIEMIIADKSGDVITVVNDITPKKTSSSWATLASKKKLCDAPIPLTRCFTTFGIEALPLKALPLKKKEAKPKAKEAKAPVKKSWADDSDDDEDETEEEEFEEQEEENDIEN